MVRKLNPTTESRKLFKMTTSSGKGILTIILLLATLCSINAADTDIVALSQADITITKDNFMEPCYKDNFCYFLGRTRVETNSASAKCRKGKACMRLNIKPKDQECLEYVFELAAINSEPGDWIAVAFGDDKHMGKDLLVYCKDGKIFNGVITSQTEPGYVSQVAEYYNWAPQPTLLSSENVEKFQHCSFTANQKSAHKDASMVNFAAGDTYILMASGFKDAAGDDFTTDDKHELAGITGKATTGMKLDNCKAAPKPNMTAPPGPKPTKPPKATKKTTKRQKNPKPNNSQMINVASNSFLVFFLSLLLFKAL